MRNGGAATVGAVVAHFFLRRGWLSLLSLALVALGKPAVSLGPPAPWPAPPKTAKLAVGRPGPICWFDWAGIGLYWLSSCTVGGGDYIELCWLLAAPLELTAGCVLLGGAYWLRSLGSRRIILRSFCEFMLTAVALFTFIR